MACCSRNCQARPEVKLRIVLLLAIAVLATWFVAEMPAVQDTLLSAAAPRAMGRDFGESDNLRVYVCGSASPLGNSRDRAQACLAVVTSEHFYVFDAGAGSAANLQADGLPLARLDGVFVTHFHSDHIADLPAMRLASWAAGRPETLKVLGPAGVEKVVAGFNLAYEHDNNYRTAHHGESLLPRVLGNLEALTLMSGAVFEDGGLRVTMFAVSHDPVHPAVGYLVEYGGRRIVISGDTIVSKPLFQLAKGADLVFHDVLSQRALRPLIHAAESTGRERIAQIMNDVIDYHADLDKLQQASKAADIQQLVLYHMVPTPVNGFVERVWKSDLQGNTVLAEDGMVFELAPLAQ